MPLGTVLFTSTITLYGRPLDRHRRTITSIEGGCELHDHLEVEPGLPGMDAPTRSVVVLVSARRHRVLTAHFGRG